LIKVFFNLLDLRVKSSKAQELPRNALCKRSYSGVFDVSQKMFYADLFSFLGANFTGNVLEGFGGGGAILYHTSSNNAETKCISIKYIVDFFSCSIGFSRQSKLPGLGIDDHQNRVGTVASDQFINSDIILVQLGARVVPAHNLFTGVHLLEHAVHVLQVVVVQEPHRPVLVVLVKGHCNRERIVSESWGQRPLRGKVIEHSKIYRNFTCKTIGDVKHTLSSPAAE
jgi:hypothetical protein